MSKQYCFCSLFIVVYCFCSLLIVHCSLFIVYCFCSLFIVFYHCFLSPFYCRVPILLSLYNIVDLGSSQMQLRFLLTASSSLPSLAAPPSSPTSPPRFTSQSSPPHLADPPHRSTSPQTCTVGAQTCRCSVAGPRQVAALSPGSYLPPPVRYQYSTNASGQSHYPLAYS